MKVCHVISGDLWAGAEAMACQLVKAQLRHGDLHPSAILLNVGRLAAELSRLGVRVSVADESRSSFPELCRALRRIIRCDRPDIIHSHGYKENILACLAAGAGGRPRLIATQHGMPEAYGGIAVKRRFLAGLNFLVLSGFFHKAVVVSREMRETLTGKLGFPAGKVEVIRNGIEIPEPAPARGDGSFVIGSSGRFFPVKDYPLLVEIGKRVLERSDRIRFELAGEGPEKRKTLDLIREYGIEHAFSLPGFVHDMRAFYPGLDLYLNTSLHEGIPMGVLEAMACGVPVIAPRVGGLPEMIDDGVEGYLVEGRDSGDFAEKCLALSRDKALRERMSHAAREKIRKEFSVEHMAGRYYRLYAEAVDSP